MMKKTLLKRLLLIFAVLALVFSMVPAFTFAQEGEGGEDAETEQVDAEHAEEDDHGEEGGEEGGGLAALGINQGFVLSQVVNFLIIFGLLTTMLWKPAINMMDARSQKIQKGLEDAAAAAKARQNAEAEADKILAEARSERQKILEEARAAGEDVQKQIETEARQEAERIRTEGRQDAEVARNTALADMRDQVLQISSAVAGRVLKENIDAKKQEKLVSDFFSSVPEGAKKMSGAVEVISAMPLSDAEKSTLEGAISADSYTYTVNPDILGGLIVRGQDKVVDGSVRGRLSGLTDNLK